MAEIAPRALAVLLAAALLLAAGCGSGSSAGSTMTLTARQAGFAPGPTFNQGQNPFRQWSASRVLTDRSGKPAGNEELSCTTSPGSAALNCADTLSLERGEIEAQGVVDRPRGVAVLPVIGGTGAYARASGNLKTTGVTSRTARIAAQLRAR